MDCLRGVVFDLDDTLISSTAAMNAAITATLPLLPNVCATDLIEALTQSYQALWGYGTPGYASLKTLPTLKLRYALTEATLDRLGLEIKPSVEAMMDCYAAAEENALQAFPGVKGTLASLKPHFRLGVITNGPSQIQREKLIHVGLSPYFDTIVADADFGVPKPDSRLFDYAAQKLGLEPFELLFAGDSAQADVAGANAAGWISVYTGKGLCPEASFTISQLEELLTLPPILEGKRLAFRRKVADTREQ